MVWKKKWTVKVHAFINQGIYVLKCKALIPCPALPILLLFMIYKFLIYRILNYRVYLLPRVPLKRHTCYLFCISPLYRLVCLAFDLPVYERLSVLNFSWNLIFLLNLHLICIYRSFPSRKVTIYSTNELFTCVCMTVIEKKIVC